MRNLHDEMHKNAFARYIVEHQDMALTNFLLLAKESECVRGMQCDPWYYPLEWDDEKENLYRICKAAEAQTDERLFERYTLQALRAYFWLNEWQKCIDLWTERERKITIPFIREQALGYVAGCHHNLGNSELANDIYRSIDRYDYCVKTKKGELIREMIYSNPSSLRALYLFKEYECFGYYDISVYDREKYEMALSASQNGKYQAYWKYYAAQYASNPHIACKLAKEGLELADNKTLKEELLALYYLNYSEIMPLDNIENEVMKICRFFEKKCKETTPVDSIYLNKWYGYSDFFTMNYDYGYDGNFWNDVFRTIMWKNIIPRMEEQCNRQLAMQMGGLADNMYLLCFDSKPEIEFYYGLPSFGKFNICTIADLERYINKLYHPQTQWEKFVSVRSYHNKMFYDELLGTKYIREEEFAKAIPYLERVTPDYEKAMNLYQCEWEDPFYYGGYLGVIARNFVYEKLQLAVICDTVHRKLHFARIMNYLQLTYTKSPDMNDRADALIEYSIALRNILHGSWPYVCYSWSFDEMGNFYDNNSMVKNQLDHLYYKALNIEKHAITLYDDRERKAAGYFRLRHNETIIKHYRYTKIGEFVAAHCDVFQNY